MANTYTATRGDRGGGTIFVSAKWSFWGGFPARGGSTLLLVANSRYWVGSVAGFGKCAYIRSYIVKIRKFPESRKVS